MSKEEFIWECNTILHKRGYAKASYFYMTNSYVVFDFHILYRTHPNNKTFSRNTNGFTFSDKKFIDIARWITELFEKEMEKYDINLSNFKYKINDCEYPLNYLL